jgi:hypothetical protein
MKFSEIVILGVKSKDAYSHFRMRRDFIGGEA